MPAILNLELYLDTVPPKHEWGFRLHGLILNFLKAKDLELANSVHNNNLNPFAVKIGHSKKNRLFCSLTVLHDDSLPTWESTLQSGITFDSEKGLSGHVVNQKVSSKLSYAELFERGMEAAAPKQVLMTFTSPTAISTADQEWPVPIPRYIFRGLLRRWNTYSKPKEHLGEGFDEWLERYVKCKGYDIHPAIAPLGKQNLQLSGFTGKATYELSDDPHQRRVFALLAKYAEYANVGTRTGYGCGEIKVKFKYDQDF
jgi:CRISPR-associated endoribonuclease Cas6